LPVKKQPKEAPPAIDGEENGNRDGPAPRRWRRARRFLKEYVTIVVGVLTALAAGQAADALHWRHEVKVQRAALLSEARDNLAAAAYRDEQTPCIRERLGELGEVFQRQARGQPLGLKRPLGRPALWIATTGSWDIALSEQALGHMPQAEKLAFSNAYDSYRAWKVRREEEEAIWARLSLLDHAELLRPEDWPALRQAYAEAVAMNERIGGLAHYNLTEATLGQRPSRPDADEVERQIRDFCRPLI
jgi:hypothetical protein